ncbi:GerAB/ArcD/ProY family transporter [Pseudobacteroides cellulosolvens]|uniref:Spore germination protein n=1 Tax=Pseudobacteroides cellulosolvens ATCC 35603 = DSM 2933 TaxID=398512 RepID=A0A0L6JSM0_9FIRM|nr:endospore germination permease [Pseudobacteroides cellulosolvens]KNY28841.1 spore germination protein [Pseudobacteroides cellulosolvens ATCC 35603 = DSM 2933]
MLASKEKISTRQAVILFLTLVYSPAIRIFPVFSAKIGERAGWLTPILAVLPLICLVYTMNALFKREKEANLSDMLIKILGRIPGRILLFIYILWLMVLLSLYVRYFAERFLTSLLPNTPMPFFTFTILIVVFYVVRGGIVPLTRTTEFLFLAFSVIFIIIFMLTLTNVKITNLLPVTYYDIWPITKSTYSILGIWGYFTFIFFFGDKINDKEHIRRFGLQGAVYLVIVTLLLLIQTIGVYGYTIIERLSMPYFVVAKSISILDTIERIESVVLAFWIIVDFVIISVFMYIILSMIKSLFNLTGAKSLISPVTIFTFIFSFYLAKNSFELSNFSSYIGLPINIVLGFIIPFILLMIGKVRRVI